MFAVRGTRTSKLRAAGGPVAHASEHIGDGKFTKLGLLREKAHTSASSKSRPRTTVKNSLTEGKGPTNSNCNSKQDVVQSPGLDSQDKAELASRELTIAKLQGKLEMSEKLACDRSVQLADLNLALEAKDAGFNKMGISLEKDKENVAQIRELKDRLTIANAEKERKAEIAADIQKWLQTEQKTLVLHRGRIQALEEELKHAGSVQKQLKEATVQMEMHSQAEARLRQELARMQIKDLKQDARPEAQVRQDVSNLKEQLQSNQDFMNKCKDKAQTDQDLRGELAKDKLLRQDNQKLASKDDELELLCRKLKEEQKKVLSYEVSLKLLQEYVGRFCSKLAEMHYRNRALKREIVRLKLEVRRYAEIIVGNKGEPFYEVRVAEGPLAFDSNLEGKRESKASEEMSKPEDDSPQTRLSRGQDPDPGQPQQHARLG